MEPVVPLPKNQFRSILQGYTQCKHHLRLAPNIVNCNCEQFKLEKYSLLPYTSSKPVYHFLDNRPTTKTDVALDLLTVKYRNSFLLATYRQNYFKAIKSKRNQEEVAAGYEPRIFADLVNVMDSDPDEYFQGDYNWYYTGGSVDVAEVDGDFYTFHMTGDKMNVLVVSPYGTSPPATHHRPIELSLDETVFEVAYENNHLILRSKSAVSLYKFHPQARELDLVLSCQGAAPFISARLRSETDLVCLDLDHILRVVPLADCHGKEREMSLAEHFEGAKDKWANLLLLRGNRLCLVVTRCKLIIVDVVLMVCTGSVDMRQLDVLSACNDISGVWRSKFEEADDETAGDLIYLSLVHNVVAIRLMTNQLSKSGRIVSFKECIRWTHQLKSPPLLLKSVLVDATTELLYVSSLVNNCTRVLYVNRSVCVQDDDDEEDGGVGRRDGDAEVEEYIGLHSYHPPFKPTDILTSFNWCHRQGELIETRHNFRTRINLCTIGLGIVVARDTEEDVEESSRSVKLLTMNSMGDIYHQRLSPKQQHHQSANGVAEGDEEQKEFLEAMRQTRNSLVDRENMNNVLTVTGCHNVKALFIDAICHDPMQEDGSFADKETPAEQRERMKRKMRRTKWNRTVGKLRRYKDVLSQDLLAIWDVSDDEERVGEDDDQERGDMNRLMEPSHKVSTWLQSTQLPVAEMDDFSMDFGSTSRYPGEGEEEEEEDQVPLEDSKLFIDTSLALPEVSSSQQQRKVAKKKRILGF